MPKPPLATASPMAAMTSGYFAMRPLSRNIWVFAVNAPPGIGKNGISGLTCVASGGMK